MNTVEILLIEDDPNDAELILLSLRNNHISNNIHLVSDGEEALDFLFCKNQYSDRNKNENPKLILLDLKLPKLHGLEVLKLIKDNPKTKNIPVIILTSSNLQADIEKGYELGANSFIQKPVDFDKFSEVVKKVGLYWLVVNRSPETTGFQSSS
ncbi:response regulator [Candidatus Dojkabacteria bacterium]|nr:response regulator [Candidatus Dojkabacteria bacterium]